MNRIRIYILMGSVLLACLMAGVMTRIARAAPASPLEFTLTQPDGSTFQARQWGDEWNHGIETLDGYSIVKDPQTGFWVYAGLQTDGTLAPSLSGAGQLVVGQADPGELPKHLRPAVLNANPRASLMATGGTPSPAGKFTGTQPTLVILVSFTDQGSIYTAATFADRFFNFYSPGSVTWYYSEVSYNQMGVVPAVETHGTTNDGVVGWVNVGYQHPNPGKGDTRPLAADAIYAADDYIDYSFYDDNENGIISTDELHIFIVAAGFEASYSAVVTPAVWANNWWIDGSYVGCPSLDGVLLGCIGEGSFNAYGGGYSIIGEKMGDHMSTLGVMVHELGHDIYWPDLYNTSAVPFTVGVGYWSVMGDGSWSTYGGGYLGNWPTHPSAWEKWYQGWLTPTPIEKEEYWINAPPVETNPTAYLLRPNAGGVDYDFQHHSGHGEYFLAEYRKQIGFDLSAPGCGILIWHINETAPSDYTANNSFQPLVRLEQADGVDWYDKGNAGDPYIGIPPRDIFNDSSSPNSRLYNGTRTGVAAYIQSTTCGSTISMALVGSRNAKLPLLLKDYPPPWITITGEMFETENFPKENWYLSEGDFMLGRTDCRAYNGIYSGWMIAEGGLGHWNRCYDPYGNYLNITFTYGPFTTVGATAAQLTYHYWTDLEFNYDWLFVGVSGNNSTYTQIPYTGNSGGWQSEVLDLNDPLQDGSISYLNYPNLWVRFWMSTDISNPLDYEGVYLDNIQLRKCMYPVCANTPVPGPALGGDPMISTMLQTVWEFVNPFRYPLKN